MLSKFRTFWKKRAASCEAGVVLYPEATIVNMRRAECIRIGAFTHVRGELLTFAHGGEIGGQQENTAILGSIANFGRPVIFMLAIVC